MPLLGRDILTKLGATLQLTQSPSASLLLLLLAPSLHGYTDSPLPVSLVNPKTGTYRLVQDLRLINEAVVPINPVVPNPYTLLSCIPSGTTHFSILYLKDAFFTIPLDPDSYHLFAFTCEDPDEQVSHQLTWMVLPQGFRDSTHLFGQALARDLQQCSLEPSTLLQYVDDLLLCSPSLDIFQRQTAGLLNFLGDKGYCVSPAKVQLLAPTVTYLGICLTPNSRGLTVDQAQAIRHLQPPTSAEQILSFLGLELHLLFLESPDISLIQSPALNPATLLPAASTQPVATHSCPEVVEALTQPRAGLSDLPLSNPDLTLFVDGSSCLDPQGCRKASNAVVTLERILEAAQLPEGTTSQKAELIALTRALHLAKGRRVAIMHCQGHQTDSSMGTRGNARADAVARGLTQGSCSGNTLTGFCPGQNQPTKALEDHPSSPGTQFSLRIYIPRPWNPGGRDLTQESSQPPPRPNYLVIHHGTTSPDSRGPRSSMTSINVSPGQPTPTPTAYVWRLKVRETYNQDSTQVTRQDRTFNIRVRDPWDQRWVAGIMGKLYEGGWSSTPSGTLYISREYVMAQEAQIQVSNSIPTG
ncbi:hypothetical protein QTO34_000669 [Cnephaeus nilssonii]|uniref:Reverse transcriptase domain-containing protein n=1 Tax=Cnephaeus nilssonii TaxID=3371016 RepID=A0AA40IBU9_CNENI|nr:hypothetical protein QTO34_000669 [Eptesicus nilssonii]